MSNQWGSLNGERSKELEVVAPSGIGARELGIVRKLKSAYPNHSTVSTGKLAISDWVVLVRSLATQSFGPRDLQRHWQFFHAVGREKGGI